MCLTSDVWNLLNRSEKPWNLKKNLEAFRVNSWVKTGHLTEFSYCTFLTVHSTLQCSTFVTVQYSTVTIVEYNTVHLLEEGGITANFPNNEQAKNVNSQYSTVQYSTVQYNTVQYSTVQYSTVQYRTVQYSTVQYSIIQCSTVQYSTAQYSTVQYNTVQYSTVESIEQLMVQITLLWSAVESPVQI